MITEVVPGVLWRSSRPGYSGERGNPVPKRSVDAWIRDARTLEIKSIICLLGEDQLGLYQDLPGDLITYYRASGFAAEHIPAVDHLVPSLSADQLEAVWRAYNLLPKPVVVHCSAGVDRTGMAVAHIQQQLQARA